MEPSVVAVIAAALAVVAAAATLWATRLSRVVVGSFVVAVAVSAVGLVCGGPGLFVVLALGASGLVVPALAAVVVVDLDGRQKRTLRPWKLLMLAPVPFVAMKLWPAVPLTHVAADVGGPDVAAAVELALLALAASLPAVLLLVRRRESA